MYQGKIGGEPLPGPLGSVGLGRPACLGLRASSVWFSVYPFNFALSAHEKKMARKNFARNSKKKKNYLQNPHLVLHPRLDVRALLPW
jgi:hypothetical protein